VGAVAANEPRGVDGFHAPIGVAKPCFDTVRHVREADQLDLALDRNPKRLKMRGEETFGLALRDHQTEVVGTCDIIKAVERQHSPADVTWLLSPTFRNAGVQPMRSMSSSVRRRRVPWRFRSDEGSCRLCEH
jgi:hypothetical protein